MRLRSLKKQIIIALGIKRRIEIDEFNRLRRNMIAQDMQGISEVEFIHGCKDTEQI